MVRRDMTPSHLTDSFLPVNRALLVVNHELPSRRFAVASDVVRVLRQRERFQTAYQSRLVGRGDIV